MRAKRVIAVFVILASACAPAHSAKIRAGGGADMASARAEKYNGPKARLAVVKFVDKSAKGAGEIGRGMAEMLTTALFHSNRYILLDRQNLDAVINEQDFASRGRVSEETAAKTGEMEGADLLIFGAITEFEPESFGAGGILMGAVTLGASIAVAMNNKGAPIGLVTYKESSVAIDIKIVDAKTARVVYTGSVEGKYQNYGGGVAGIVRVGRSSEPVYLGGFAGTGAERAVRKCIDKAVVDIVRHTPDKYLRVIDNMDTTTAGRLVAFYPIDLGVAMSTANVKKHQAVVVGGDKEYQELLTTLSLSPETAPAIDWEKHRLIAVFAGPKPDQTHLIGVTKVIQRDKTLEVIIRQTQRAQTEEEEQSVVPELSLSPANPYSVVRINDTSKPLNFIWKE